MQRTSECHRKEKNPVIKFLKKQRFSEKKCFKFEWYYISCFKNKNLKYNHNKKSLLKLTEISRYYFDFGIQLYSNENKTIITIKYNHQNWYKIFIYIFQVI